MWKNLNKIKPKIKNYIQIKRNLEQIIYDKNKKKQIINYKIFGLKIFYNLIFKIKNIN